MPTVVPAPFLFRFALPVRHVPGLPRDREPWLDLPESCRLLNAGSLGDEPQFAELRAAWNADGLAIAVKVKGKSFPPFCDADDVLRSDGLRLWMDMRDTKTLHHATRFCQHFILLPAGGGEDGLQAVVKPLPVPRAREESPRVDEEDVLVWSRHDKTGYELEAWFPASVLNGFDPASQPRMGFFYQVHDSELGDQSFNVTSSFPTASDPSLWGTLQFEA